jgi:hypothetical protein
MTKAKPTAAPAAAPEASATTPAAETTQLLAKVGQRIEDLEEAHAEATAQAAQAMQELQGLWATPVTAQQFADLVVTHMVDKPAAEFYNRAGVAKILGQLAEPMGYRTTAPVDTKVAMYEPEKVARALTGGQNANGLGQTGERLCAADVIALGNARAGMFELMAEVSAGSILGVPSDDELKPGQRRELMASAFAWLGGDVARRQLHTWALTFYRQKYPSGTDDAGVLNTEELCARIGEKQQAVAALKQRLAEIEDELVSLPPMHFDRSGLMTARAQVAARAARNLPPVYGPSH